MSILTSRKDVQTDSVSVLMFCLNILFMFGVSQFHIFVCFSTDQCLEAWKVAQVIKTVAE